jgi:hypothetical protein
MADIAEFDANKDNKKRSAFLAVVEYDSQPLSLACKGGI